MSAEQVAEVRTQLLDRPCMSGHIPNAKTDIIARFIDCGAEEYWAGAYRVSDIATTSHLLKAALDDFVLDLGAAYLGCIPTLTWLQTWWNFTDPKIDVIGSLAQRFHRDQNDCRCRPSLKWNFV